MIKILKKFYKKDPSSGKLELGGIDGAEHAVISAFVITIAAIASLIMRIPHIIIITYIVMRLVWFFIEQGQEKAMQKNDPKRKKVSLWKFWQWSKARKVDMYYSVPFDTIITIIIMKVLF